MNDRRSFGQAGTAGQAAPAQPVAPPTSPGGVPDPCHPGSRPPSGGPPKAGAAVGGEPPKWRRTSVLTAAALAVGLFGAIGFGKLHGASSPDPAPSASEQAQIEAEWVGAKASGIALARVPADQQKAAVQSLSLPQANADRLAADVQAGKIEMVWVSVWDNQAEDGDVVDLSSGSVHQQVTLMHGAANVALPMPQDHVVRLTGMRDGGGGGITVGVMNGSAPVRIPPMALNQVLTMPVR